MQEVIKAPLCFVHLSTLCSHTEQMHHVGDGLGKLGTGVEILSWTNSKLSEVMNECTA
jgi:hypothetical protein